MCCDGEMSIIHPSEADDVVNPPQQGPPRMNTETLTSRTILLVDDEEANLDLLEGFLQAEGYTALVRTTDPRKVNALMEAHRPDLVLLDLHMPHKDGFTVLRELQEQARDDDYVPVLVLTADINPQARERALSGGARDFLTKPFDVLEVLLRVRNLLETRVLYLRQREAREAAERSERRSAFLAEASRVLASSFDTSTTLAQLARLAVPELADLCVVDVLDADGTYAQAAAAHVDPEKEGMIQAMAPRQPGRSHPFTGLYATGDAVLLSEVPESLLAEVAGGARMRELVGAIGPQSAMVVPLRVGDLPIGGLTLVAAESGRRYTDDDLELAAELARRAALAVENARLFAQAQSAIHARDEMLAVVAHDLRNPVSTIVLGTDLLLDVTPDDAAHAFTRRHLATVKRSAVRMNRLIQDLLEVSRMVGGKLALSPQDEEMRLLMTEASAMLRPLAEARGIAFHLRTSPELPRLRMDGARVMQVVSNLVGNAVKFTPEGGSVTLGAEWEGSEVHFSVADTGAGIPPEHLPHVFGRFWQANDADRRGLGLGLAIARGIVEAHGGRIWVESEVGEGSTFHFTLPAPPREPVQQTAPVQTPAAPRDPSHDGTATRARVIAERKSRRRPPGTPRRRPADALAS
jgi:signal transduction histidine kinase/DNA-binding response OmpR family regulator